MNHALQIACAKPPNTPYTDEYWECKWVTSNVIGKSHVVSSRNLSRWGASAACIDRKLYIYGGRGADSRAKSSLHVLDLDNYSVTAMRWLNLPLGREGHSMVSFKSLLLIFGGCEGGKDDEESFDDLQIIDVDNKVWNKAQVTGKKPKGREGHGAGVIDNYMIIYGGKGQGSLYNDIFALDLLTFEWKELEQHGNLPGPRESMSSAVLGNSLYIFGGNICTRSAEEDEYTNDFYSICIKNNTAQCKKINALEPLPPKRLSHSMSNLNNHFLIVCGGESYGKTLNDVWVFNVDSKIWREIVPGNQLRGRMTHICYSHKDTLIVFGGMTHEKAVLNELAVLNFGKNKKHTNGTELNSRHGSLLVLNDKSRSNSITVTRNPSQFICYECGHDSSSCDFYERFPEVGNPCLNFYSRVQIPPFTMQMLCNEFTDKWMGLIRICELLGSHSVAINVTGESQLLNSVFCKFEAPNISIDLSNLPVCDNDESIELRTMLLSGWASNEAAKALIIEFYSKVELSPGELCKLLAGSGPRNFVPALLKLSNIGLIISKGDELISVCLVHLSEYYIPMYFVVFNQDRNMMFPFKEIFQANLMNIFNHSHLKDLNDVFYRPNGTFIYVYVKDLQVVNNDLLSQGNSLKALLEKDKRMKYCLLENNIEFCESKKVVVQDTVMYTCSKCESDTFSLLVYFKKKVVYWEYKKVDGRKRVRDECFEIEIKDVSLINQMTGHLDWNQKSLSILHDAIGGTRKKVSDE